MSKEEKYAEHTVAWELPNGDSVTKSNYNLADIETKYTPIQTEVICDDKDKTIADLEAKLAESEKTIENLRIDLKDYQDLEEKISTKYDKVVEQLAESEIRSKESEIFYKREINRRDTKLRNIKLQLTEKDKEITRLKQLVDGFDELKQYDKDSDLILINPKNYYIDGYRLVLKADDYDKISFCIEQLEKVKELCKEKFDWWENSEWEGNIYDKSDVSNAYFDIEANIDNQIEQLKEMK